MHDFIHTGIHHEGVEVGRDTHLNPLARSAVKYFQAPTLHAQRTGGLSISRDHWYVQAVPVGAVRTQDCEPLVVRVGSVSHLVVEFTHSASVRCTVRKQQNNVQFYPDLIIG